MSNPFIGGVQDADACRSKLFGEEGWGFGVWLSLGCGLVTLACGGAEGTQQAGEGDVNSAAAPVRDLSVGSRGADVEALHAYLRRYGYLPSSSFQHDYPELSPLVDVGPARDDVFDSQTKLAVEFLQHNMGLSNTSIVDEATRENLATPRCGVPDAVPRTDDAEKFGYMGCRQHDHHVTWRIVNEQIDVSSNADVNLTQTKEAIKRAFATLSAETELTTSLGGSGDAVDVELRWVETSQTWLANTTGGCNSKVVAINSAKRWAAPLTGSTPSDRFDFESVILHEIGHAIGISHSAASGAVMRPSISAGVQRRVLTADDAVALSGKYDEFEQLPGHLLDVGAGSGGAVWGIGTGLVGSGAGGHTVHAWTGSSWFRVTGAADRIAVGPDGVPWLVNAQNEIYRRTTSDWNTGSFQQLVGCAHDIGIGANGDAWIIDCVGASGGFRVSKWNGSSWNRTSDFGAGVRIAVAADGIPWIVNDIGKVFRRSTPSTLGGSWEEIPAAALNTIQDTVEPISATDIAIGTSLALSPAVPKVWVTSNHSGGGYSINLWDEQTGSGSGGSQVPDEFTWVQVLWSETGASTGISAAPTGPWYLDAGANVFRPTK